MQIQNLRSPYDTVDGIVYVGRMFDKIRLHLAGKLPEDYRTNFGKGFDGRCLNFFRADFSRVVERVREGGADPELLRWCRETFYNPTEFEVELFNSFLMKRGWRDDATETLEERKKTYGVPPELDVQTFFDLLDLDEGRFPRAR
ncbi:MAG: DUF5069 domain-containing protein [Verrucomicrobiae bacterium]|nr:DUF5069 domain-containing protein [Verrucomicrobiae bacterium]